ncbi:MAG TPA: hypothetical protein VNQ52_03435 [Microbacteriaceae bacterium]|nr:hypothetical protein [Microbacteriaceae bacterium]
MSSVVRPRGPLPPKVYWRRRLVVIAILVAIIVVLVIIFIPRGEAAPGPTASTADSEVTGPLATPTPTAGGECDPSRVTITADTDKTEYAAGELPQLWFTLENKTSQPCTMQIGAADSTFVLSSPSGSGDETYWTTADCAATEESAPVTVTLKPGIPEESQKVSWPRARSTPGDCTLTEPQVGGDGASFDFHVTLDGLTATKRIYLY